jgi:uncharacterized coiled-coil DUF342 family protein
MEKITEGVQQVKELLFHKEAEIDHFHHVVDGYQATIRELNEELQKTREELEQCKTEIITLSQLKRKKLPKHNSSPKLFGWI